MAHQAFKVYKGKKLIDTVFYTGYTAEEVRRSLINHDGYDSDIRVVKERKAAAKTRANPRASNPSDSFRPPDVKLSYTSIWYGPGETADEIENITSVQSSVDGWLVGEHTFLGGYEMYEEGETEWLSVYRDGVEASSARKAAMQGVAEIANLGGEEELTTMEGLIHDSLLPPDGLTVKQWKKQIASGKKATKKNPKKAAKKKAKKKAAKKKLSYDDTYREAMAAQGPNIPRELIYSLPADFQQKGKPFIAQTGGWNMAIAFDTRMLVESDDNVFMVVDESGDESIFLYEGSNFDLAWAVLTGKKKAGKKKAAKKKATKKKATKKRKNASGEAHTRGDATLAAGLGSLGGALVGSVLGPLGAEVGSIAGAVAGGHYYAPPESMRRTMTGAGIGGVFGPVGAAIGGYVGAGKPDGQRGYKSKNPDEHARVKRMMNPRNY